MRLTKDGEKVLEEARKILEATEKISSMKGGSPRLTGNGFFSLFPLAFRKFP